MNCRISWVATTWWILALTSPSRSVIVPTAVVAFTNSHWNVPSKRSKHLTGYSYSSSLLLNAKPKQGSVVDSYQTVSVQCAKCNERLFRYKKKNGTKSSLVKCYIERITEDSAEILAKQELSGHTMQEYSWECPNCQTQFARSSLIHGRPALKMVGGKVRMSKK